MRTFICTVAFIAAAGVAAAQDPLAAARDLYASARYDEALAALNTLRVREDVSVKPADVRALEQYRSLCLLALGRSSEAEEAISNVIAVDPFYVPAEGEAAPRIRGAFQDVRTSRDLYAEAVRRTKDKWQMGFVAEGHAAVMAYAKAIQSASTSETQAIVKALEAVTFDTATGPRSFRKEDHQAVKPVVMVHMRGNHSAPDGFEVIDYVKVAGRDVIDPPTPGKALVVRSARQG